MSCTYIIQDDVGCIRALAFTIIIHHRRRNLTSPPAMVITLRIIRVYKIHATGDQPCSIVLHRIYIRIVQCARLMQEGQVWTFVLYNYTLTLGNPASGTRTFYDRSTMPSHSPGPPTIAWEQQRLSRPRHWNTVVVSSSCREPGQIRVGSQQY